MSQLKPPTGQNQRSRSTTIKVTNSHYSRFDTKISDISVLKRRNADLQKRIAVQRRVDNKSSRQILEELLTSLKEEALRGLASRERRGVHKVGLKRVAPLRPFLHNDPFFLVSSTPELASEGPTSPLGPPAAQQVTRRTKLRKSLSLSGSRMLFHSIINTIRSSSRRRSRSEDSIFDLAYLDQDQQVVRNAARQAQNRRGTVVEAPRQGLVHTRSLSAEPRTSSSGAAVTRDPTPDGRRPEAKAAARRPDKLFLGSPLPIRNKERRFREKSPLVKTPILFVEKAQKMERKSRRPISKRASEEIEAFEKLIANFMEYNLPSTNL